MLRPYGLTRTYPSQAVQGTGYGCRRPDCGLCCNDGVGDSALASGSWSVVRRDAAEGADTCPGAALAVC